MGMRRPMMSSSELINMVQKYLYEFTWSGWHMVQPSLRGVRGNLVYRPGKTSTDITLGESQLGHLKELWALKKDSKFILR